MTKYNNRIIRGYGRKRYRGRGILSSAMRFAPKLLSAGRKGYTLAKQGHAVYQGTKGAVNSANAAYNAVRRKDYKGALGHATSAYKSGVSAGRATHRAAKMYKGFGSRRNYSASGPTRHSVHRTRQIG